LCLARKCATAVRVAVAATLTAVPAAAADGSKREGREVVVVCHNKYQAVSDRKTRKPRWCKEKWR